jgi:glutamate synthase (NADPH/NADH) small chain
MKGHNPLKPSERLKILRQEMPEREAALRAHDFAEVNLGFDPGLAASEAARCIECAKPAARWE